MRIKPPENETVLRERAAGLAGKTVAQIALAHGKNIPQSLLHAKGWMGEVLECALGTSAGNTAQPDFVNLGIELKTLPINQYGKPLESTYVTTLPLTTGHGLAWRSSEVYQKLKRVLWVPIVSERQMPITERCVANPFLWTLSAQDEQVLANDWQEIMDMVLMGQIAKLSGRFGRYLHVRPKAAHSRCLTKAFDSEGNIIQTLPRGFYLRSQFTVKILQETFQN